MSKVHFVIFTIVLSLLGLSGCSDDKPLTPEEKEIYNQFGPEALRNYRATKNAPAPKGSVLKHMKNAEKVRKNGAKKD